MSNNQFAVINCGKCGRTLGVNSTLIGQKGLCPFCKSEVEIPSTAIILDKDSIKCDGYIQTKRSKLRIAAACLQLFIMLINLFDSGLSFFTFISVFISIALLLAKGSVFRSLFFFGAWIYIATFIRLLFQGNFSFCLFCGLLEAIFIAISITKPHNWHDNYRQNVSTTSNVI